MMRHNRSGFWGAKAEIGMVVLCGCPGLPTLAGNFFNTTLSAHRGHDRNDVNDPSELIAWNSEFFNQYKSMLHPHPPPSYWRICSYGSKIELPGRHEKD